MKKALVLIAHGSKQESSNQEVISLVESIRPSLSEEFAIIQVSFLEFKSPGLKESLQICLDQGAEDIVVLPYFLAAGKHVTVDLPNVVKHVAEKNPHCKIELKEHIGFYQQQLGTLILEAIR